MDSGDAERAFGAVVEPMPNVPCPVHIPRPPRESTESTGPSILTTVIVLKASRLRGTEVARPSDLPGMGESRKPSASTGFQ